MALLFDWAEDAVGCDRIGDDLATANRVYRVCDSPPVGAPM